MSTVGLTKAMRDGLELASRGYIDLIKRPTWVRLREAELVDLDGKLTPRGHAAWVAPRMTQAELTMLERAEADGAMYYDTSRPLTAQCLVLRNARKNGWLDCGRSLTPAGRTALNNVRAAMGSPDWKEGL